MGVIREQQSIVSMQDGLTLSLLMLIPEGHKKGIIQIHHGMSEYKERYLPFMEYLAAEGYVAVIHDCRGHGQSVRSPEDLGYMYGVGAWGLVEDTHQITMLLRRRWPDLSLILFGHSMGSLVVRTYAKRYDQDLDMLIVCGSPSRNPALGVGLGIAAAEKRLFGDHYRSKILLAASFGGFAKAFSKEKSRFAWCCSDPQVVAAYEASPLCGFGFTVDGYQTLFELMKETYSREGWKVRHPQMPILFLGGAEDPCIAGARKYAQSLQQLRLVGYRKVKGRLYPHMRHEILNETEHQKVFEEVRKYIEKYVASAN